MFIRNHVNRNTRRVIGPPKTIFHVVGNIICSVKRDHPAR